MAVFINRNTAQQIVDTIKDICEHNINFIDTNGRIFASTDASRIGGLHEIGRQVIQTGEIIEVEADNSFLGTQKGINIPFIYKGEVIGVIGISGIPDQVRKYAYLAQKITSLILREKEIDAQNHTTQAQMNYMIHSLITNESINYNYFMDFLEQNQLSVTADYSLVLIQLNSRYNPSNLSMIEHQIYQLFNLTGSKLYTFQYPNEYILIAQTEELKKWEFLFEEFAEKNKDILKIGIGDRTVITKQYFSYETAVIAVNSILKGSNIACFEKLDLELLLGGVSSNAKERFKQRVLSSLNEKDIDLLTTYFSCDMSLKQTCDKLFMHKNTLQYQLNRIFHKSGYNPRSFHDAAILYLGLKLCS